MHNFQDLTGQTFGKITVLERFPTKIKTFWRTLCDCGQEKIYRSDALNDAGTNAACDDCQFKNKYQSFVETAKEKYGNQYSYKFEDFKGLDSFTTITCKDHGDFSYKPYYHLNKIGCSACRKEKSQKSISKSFIEFCSKLHGNRYDYSLVLYKGTHGFIDIVCNTHGVFKQRAGIHKAGHGCQACGKESITHNNESFKDKADTVHSFKYDYSSVEYSGSFSKILIKCHEHGIFEQTPASHLQGSGCPTCVYAMKAYSFVDKYTKYPELGSKEGFLYLMEVKGNGENFLKFGISTDIGKRTNAYKREENYDFTLIKSWKTSRILSAEVEQAALLKKKFEKWHYWPRLNFDGRSECVSMGYKDLLVTFIEQELFNKIQ